MPLVEEYGDILNSTEWNKVLAALSLGFLDRGAFGLEYVDLYIKKGVTTVKIAIRETTGDEDKVKALAQKAVGRF